MNYEVFEMTITIIYVVFLSINAEEGTHRIETPNSGNIDSVTMKDIFEYYTKLATFAIHPTKTRFITFQVKACNDAFMLLSSASDLNSANFYELVFGGGKNAKIFLRRKYGIYNQRAMKYCVKCLSCDKYNTFTVKWLSEGTIVIMKNSTVYIQWKDPDPLPVNGIGITTGWGAVGYWIFGKAKVNDKTTTLKSTTTSSTLTTTTTSNVSPVNKTEKSTPTTEAKVNEKTTTLKTTTTSSTLTTTTASNVSHVNKTEKSTPTTEGIAATCAIAAVGAAVTAGIVYQFLRRATVQSLHSQNVEQANHDRQNGAGENMRRFAEDDALSFNIEGDEYMFGRRPYGKCHNIPPLNLQNVLQM